MGAVLHELHDRGESFEIVLLARAEWVPLEMWNDLCCQVGDASSLELHGAIRSIRAEGSASESSLEELQDLGAVTVLTDGEARPDLPAELVPFAAIESHAETAFPISVSGQIRQEVRVFVHLHLGEPASCDSHRLNRHVPDSKSHRPQIASTSRGQSLRGHEDFPRRYLRSLRWDRVGFTDMSRWAEADRSAPGQVCGLPDKEFRLTAFLDRVDRVSDRP